MPRTVTSDRGQAFSALLREWLHKNQTADHVLSCRHITLDPVKGTVSKDGTEIHLFPMEYALLHFLLTHPGQTFSSEALRQRIWKNRFNSNSDTVRTYIKTLRKKIDNIGEPSLIKTVASRGYVLER